MSATPRRLVVVSARFPFGSQEAYLSAELGELVKHFERIAVMPVRTPAAPARHDLPDRVEVIGWPLFGAEVVRRAAQALRTAPSSSLRAVAQLVRSRDPGQVKNLAVAVKALALAQWIGEHGFDHVHAYWMSTPATVAMVAAAASGVPWSATAHRWDIYERNAFDVKQRTASFVRTISARGTTDLTRRMPRMRDRVLELRLGTSLPPAPCARSFAGSEFRIVCPAALVEVKGHDVLLASLARLREWGVPVRCILCGTGPLQRKLEATAGSLHLDGCVEFAGFVPQRILHDWYRAGRFAAVVLASRFAGERAMEGVPSTLIEAMAFGVPVVASDSGSIGELLDDRCGRIVRAGDAEQLARALLGIYLDPDSAQIRARRAYNRVAAQHDVRVQMRELAAAVGERS
jgi:colanic acid/amylovoran biosynthesis glycosyltransferase